MRMSQSAKGRVTGIGGIFFESEDLETVRSWYRDRLGIPTEAWGGSVFHWRSLDDPQERGYTVWSPFPPDSTKFAPSEQPYMLNYRVEHLPELLADLRAAGVEVVGELEEHENGKFAWILDPEGRKIELWEPVPSAEDPYL
jgi:catechol 2,3-dioxygenase-like lactoylglutathione lyase family enzyme